jgi:hypothetical protein
MSVVSDAMKYPRLALDLRHFLRNRVSLEQSKQVITERLRNRETNFLSRVHKGIYQNPRSPYHRLLKLAGCEYEDVESLVSQDGVEGALRRLLEEGVYLSWEEFRGKADVVRGATRFRFRQSDLDNPFISGWYKGRSSGSRSRGTRTKFDLRYRLDQSFYRLPMLTASNALGVPLGIWRPIPPAMAGVAHVLDFWIAGQPVARWFSPVSQREVRAQLRDRLALRYIIYGGRLWGARLAKPEHVSLARAEEVARWIAATKSEFGGCSLSSPVSTAVKVCHAAVEHGLAIQGALLFVSGEPLTEAKRRQMEATGVSVTARYNMSEVGQIGIGCSQPGAIDDVHLLSDSVAMIQRRRRVGHTDIDVHSFLYTSLLPSAPKILLNMESDDYGVVERRSCGCLFGELGLDRHLSTIRSYTKVSGGGITLMGSDFVRILEEVLPHKYGGAVTDYQLLEEEDSQGRTRLSLIISPGVGAVDDRDVIATVLGELRRNVHSGGLNASLWSQAEALRVKRMEPITKSGKIMTLHLAQMAETSPD